MAGLGEVNRERARGWASPRLTNDLFGTAGVFVFGIGATGHVGQVASVAGAMDPPARIVGKTVVASTTAGNVAKGGVATGDEALVKLLPRAGVARAIAEEDVLATHFDEFEVGQNANRRVTKRNHMGRKSHWARSSTRVHGVSWFLVIDRAE
jgi:hypothetical protein